MAIISVDLASRDYCDIGVVVLDKCEGRVRVSPIVLGQRGLRGAPVASDLTDELLTLAQEVSAGWIFIDGPQGWRAPQSEYPHCRCCEHALATQGKTGLPGCTKPANYLGFISFAITLFDNLALKGWPRLPEATVPGARSRCAVESFPTSAWRSLGMPPLPGKSSATRSDIRTGLNRLRKAFALGLGGELSHDELQALVSGLAGLALEFGHAPGVAFAGVAPFEVEGSWREGFIVNPTRDAAA